MKLVNLTIKLNKLNIMMQNIKKNKVELLKREEKAQILEEEDFKFLIRLLEKVVG